MRFSHLTLFILFNIYLVESTNRTDSEISEKSEPVVRGDTVVDDVIYEDYEYVDDKNRENSISGKSDGEKFKENSTEPDENSEGFPNEVFLSLRNITADAATAFRSFTNRNDIVDLQASASDNLNVTNNTTYDLESAGINLRALRDAGHPPVIIDESPAGVYLPYKHAKIDTADLSDCALQGEWKPMGVAHSHLHVTGDNSHQAEILQSVGSYAVPNKLIPHWGQNYVDESQNLGLQEGHSGGPHNHKPLPVYPPLSESDDGGSFGSGSDFESGGGGGGGGGVAGGNLHQPHGTGVSVYAGSPGHFQKIKSGSLFSPPPVPPIIFGKKPGYWKIPKTKGKFHHDKRKRPGGFGGGSVSSGFGFSNHQNHGSGGIGGGAIGGGGGGGGGGTVSGGHFGHGFGGSSVPFRYGTGGYVSGGSSASFGSFGNSGSLGSIKGHSESPGIHGSGGSYSGSFGLYGSGGGHSGSTGVYGSGGNSGYFGLYGGSNSGLNKPYGSGGGYLGSFGSYGSNGGHSGSTGLYSSAGSFSGPAGGYSGSGASGLKSSYGGVKGSSFGGLATYSSAFGYGSGGAGAYTGFSGYKNHKGIGGGGGGGGGGSFSSGGSFGYRPGKGHLASGTRGQFSGGGGIASGSYGGGNGHILSGSFSSGSGGGIYRPGGSFTSGIKNHGPGTADGVLSSSGGSGGHSHSESLNYGLGNSQSGLNAGGYKLGSVISDNLGSVHKPDEGIAISDTSGLANLGGSHSVASSLANSLVEEVPTAGAGSGHPHSEPLAHYEVGGSAGGGSLITAGSSFSGHASQEYGSGSVSGQLITGPTTIVGQINHGPGVDIPVGHLITGQTDHGAISSSGNSDTAYISNNGPGVGGSVLDSTFSSSHVNQGIGVGNSLPDATFLSSHINQDFVVHGHGISDDSSSSSTFTCGKNHDHNTKYHTATFQVADHDHPSSVDVLQYQGDAAVLIQASAAPFNDHLLPERKHYKTWSNKDDADVSGSDNRNELVPQTAKLSSNPVEQEIGETEAQQTKVADDGEEPERHSYYHEITKVTKIPATSVGSVQYSYSEYETKPQSFTQDTETNHEEPEAEQPQIIRELEQLSNKFQLDLDNPQKLFEDPPSQELSYHYPFHGVELHEEAEKHTEGDNYQVKVKEEGHNVVTDYPHYIHANKHQHLEFPAVNNKRPHQIKYIPRPGKPHFYQKTNVNYFHPKPPVVVLRKHKPKQFILKKQNYEVHEHSGERHRPIGEIFPPQKFPKQFHNPKPNFAVDRPKGGWRPHSGDTLPDYKFQEYSHGKKVKKFKTKQKILAPVLVRRPVVAKIPAPVIRVVEVAG